MGWRTAMTNFSTPYSVLTVADGDPCIKEIPNFVPYPIVALGMGVAMLNVRR